MKMNDSFKYNSTNEIAFRYLMILYITEAQKNTDELAIFDFLTIYSKAFGIGEYNLHGNNEYNVSEYTARRAQAEEAIRMLVLKGLVDVADQEDGRFFAISVEGISVCDRLTTAYAANYMITAYLVDDYIGNKSADKLIAFITKDSLKNRR